MKAIITLLLISGTLVFLFVSLTQKKIPVHEISVLKDVTDTLISKPEAPSIVSLYPFSPGDNESGALFRTATISDVSFTKAFSAELKGSNRWLSNEFTRATQIDYFKNGITGAIEKVNADTSARENSSVYRAIANELIRLSESPSTFRHLIIYSDLMENTVDLSFYKKDVIHALLNAPASIEQRLQDIQALPNLSGITVKIVFQPENPEQDKLFTAVSNIYTHLLEEKGAEVTVSASI